MGGNVGSMAQAGGQQSSGGKGSSQPVSSPQAPNFGGVGTAASNMFGQPSQPNAKGGSQPATPAPAQPYNTFTPQSPLVQQMLNQQGMGNLIRSPYDQYPTYGQQPQVQQAQPQPPRPDLMAYQNAMNQAVNTQQASGQPGQVRFFDSIVDQSGSLQPNPYVGTSGLGAPNPAATGQSVILSPEEIQRLNSDPIAQQNLRSARERAAMQPLSQTPEAIRQRILDARTAGRSFEPSTPEEYAAVKSFQPQPQIGPAFSSLLDALQPQPQIGQPIQGQDLAQQPVLGRPQAPDTSQNAYNRFMAQASFAPGKAPTYEQWSQQQNSRYQQAMQGLGSLRFTGMPPIQRAGGFPQQQMGSPYGLAALRSQYNQMMAPQQIPVYGRMPMYQAPIYQPNMQRVMQNRYNVAPSVSTQQRQQSEVDRLKQLMGLE